MGAEQSVSAPRRNQLAASAVFRSPQGGSTLSKMPEGVIMVSQTPGIRGMSDKGERGVAHPLRDAEQPSVCSV